MAKTNGHEPYAYLSRILRDLPKAKTVDDFEAPLTSGGLDSDARFQREMQ